MRLTVVRHGRTAWNLAGRFQGHIDVPLDDEGRAQAQVAAERLRGEHFDRAIASDLCRAVETASIILGPGATIERDKAWREMAFGLWEGLTWAEIENAFPAMRAQAAMNVRSFDPPEGESFERLCERIGGAAQRLAEASFDTEAVLLVTHAAAIHALLRVTGIAPGGALGLKLVPASISRLNLESGRWSLEALNTTSGPIAGGTEFLRGADNGAA
jgi:broad specificity phosphatase PhoE